MALFIFAMATLSLAISFPHWEPAARYSGSGPSRLLGAMGVIAHLAATAAIGWTGGIFPAIGAFILIPVFASGVYSLLVSPLLRDKRTQRRASSNREEGHRHIPQL
jgi:hypothetical protein